METQDNNAATPSFCMLELSAHSKDIVYVFLYNGTRFFVTISAEDLEGKGELLHQFNNFKAELDDPDNMFHFEEWVLAALDGFMRQAAPTPAPGAPKVITLLEYFSPTTFAFNLVNNEGSLSAVQECYHPEMHGDTSPRTQIVDSLDLTDSHDVDPEVILRSTLPSVPVIPASKLERVSEGLCAEELSDIPTKVRHVDTNNVFFFKAGFKDHGHLRELGVLSQINSSQVSPPLRTSKLVGLVVWDDDVSCLMGFLLEYIEGETLDLRAESASAENKMKWMRQIEVTVKQLHKLGIVWGDVKPDNVIVDSAGDAVVVDFGGGYTPGYIEKGLQQTFQGDLVGLDHMAAEMG
ncbi:kinase domain-containing protein [Pochonia chlamydosporia 170]|uniref:Kinase domain-containing protein n=1 Tax=Pochonia chlamydosporia 170 TaxID=1380566 RepID=A0A179FAU8_METCM|nr:kinase domain-containing protein [Pochonia chlamydosporia 170]OAQ62430.1 kinase domain-containing protein [Pochonia chlamydosporia 170]